MVFRTQKLAIFHSGLTVLFAALFLVATMAPSFAQDFRFTEFDVQGNQRIEESTILTYAGINRGEAVSGGLQRLARDRDIVGIVDHDHSGRSYGHGDLRLCGVYGRC